MRHLSVGDRLPPVQLSSAHGRMVLQSQPRRNLALLLLPENLAGWMDYLEHFRRAAPGFREWYGRPMLVLSKADGDLLSEGGDDAVLAAADPERVLAGRLGMEPGQAGLLVADRWGEIYHLTRAWRAEDLPRVEEVEEWLKYLATQCPECGVPDESGHGEWGLNDSSAGASA